MSISTTLGRRRSLSALLVIAALAVEGHRALEGRHVWTNTCEVLNVARSLAYRGAYSDPFSAPTGPTAHVAPVFPVIIAGLIRVGGESALPPALHVIRLLAFGLHCWLLILLGDKLGDWRAGFAAGILTVILPCYAIQQTLYWEALIAGTAAMGWIAFSWDRVRQGCWVMPALSAGILLLLSPAMIAVVLPVTTLRSSRVKTAALCLLGTALTCIPWMLRNWVAVGSFSIRDNFGLELHLSNAPGVHPTMVENWEHPAIFHPYSRANDLQAIRTEGEARYYAAHQELAIQWIFSHPVEFARLTGERMWYFVFPPPMGFRRYAFSVWIITALSLIGFAVLFQRDRTTFWALATALLSYSAVYSIIEAHIRYRYPMLWESELLAGFAIMRLSYYAVTLPLLKRAPDRAPNTPFGSAVTCY